MHNNYNIQLTLAFVHGTTQYCYVLDTSTLFQYYSPLSDFYRAPSGNDHFFSANTAVIK